MQRVPLTVGERDVVASLADGDVTLAELSTAITGQVVSGGMPSMRLSDRVVPAATAIADAGLRPGDVLDLVGTHRARTPPAGWAVHVVAGVDAGRVIPIRDPAPLPPPSPVPGRGSAAHQPDELGDVGIVVTIGRSPTMDVMVASNAVSSHHCTLSIIDGDLFVTDEGSRNGTALRGEQIEPLVPTPVEFGQPVRCGPSVVVVRAATPPDTPRNMVRLLDETPTGTVPFYRSPIDLPDTPGGEIPLPPGPRNPRSGRPSFLMFLLPLAMAGAMIYFTKNWFFAMFALMMPVMMLVTSLDTGVRNRKIRKKSKKRYSDEIDEFVDDVRDASAHELRRRRDAHPDLTEILRRANGVGAALWTRRKDHPWYLTLSAGIGDVKWELPVEQVPDELIDLDDLVDEWKVLKDSPVEVSAPLGTTIGLAGERQTVLAHTRALLLQIAVQHGPADVRIVIVTSARNVSDWDWAKWLPHLRPSFTGGRLLVAVADAAGRLDGGDIDDVIADIEGANDVVALIDTDGLSDAGDVAVKRLLRRIDRSATGIVLAPTVDGLPDQTDIVIEHADAVGEATVRHPRDNTKTQECIFAGLAEPAAERAARALAKLADPDAGGGSTSLPVRTSHADLLDLGEASAADVTARWAASTGPVVVAGLGESGPVMVDLVAHGPHLVVVGGRGSGKTEHLTAMVLGMAASQPPEQLHLVLWGESFSHLHRLPHVASSVSRVDEGTLNAFMDGLDRELTRRERRRTAGKQESDAAVGDAADAADTAGDVVGEEATAPPSEPRLVIVIDDIDNITRIVPSAADDVVRLLRRARNVGVHVIWSASRHNGGTLADLIDLSALRLVLRVGAASDSTDLLGSDIASRLERTLPGRGFVLAGRSEPIEVQGGAVSVGAPRPSERIETAPFDLVDGRKGFARVVLGKPDERGLANIIAAAGATCARPPDLLSQQTAAASAMPSPGLLELLGIDGLGALPSAIDNWIDTDADSLLRLPIGVDPEVRPVLLDLKESAHGGMGPHGLLVGATGSGKSELLRTLVGGLALTHSPEMLAFVLVDFKGGASFASLGRLPHVSGVVTNLADDLALVDRILAALGGEQRRRQELLAEAGNLANVGEYRAARRAGKLPSHLADQPLPELVMVVDEFAELLDQEPAFIDFFLTIGRVGRSLGIHMLLASQRLEEGKLRGLDTYLSYRLGLRTFSAAESRIVLGSPDAYSLPQAPGGGFLKVGSSTFDRFQGSYVSGPLSESERGDDDDPDATVLDAIVDQLADAADEVHQIWLPPLESEIALDSLFPAGFVHDADRGFAAARWPRTGALAAPVGLIDEPAFQRQVPMVLDFAGEHANLAIVGAPQTGKSLLLRSAALALAVTHTPDEAQIYAVDYGGGTLASIEGLPHVGAVASRLEPERVRRLLAHVEGVLAQREALFSDLGIDSIGTFRKMRGPAARADAGDGSGDDAEREGRGDSDDNSDDNSDVERGSAADIFLVIDGWAAFRERFESLEPMIADIASRGLGYGIHVVVTLNRWMEMRPNVIDSIGGRIELRLNSAIDSMIDRKRAAVIKVDQPGRGLHSSGLFTQIALPRLDGKHSSEHLPGATRTAVEHIASRWDGPSAPPVRLLPSTISVNELEEAAEGDSCGVPVGLAEQGMQTWQFDLTAGDPHFFVYGDGESGKTTFLSTWLNGIARTQSPDDAQIVLVDYRRTLLEAIPESHLQHYAASEPAAIDVIAAVAAEITERLPGADVTAAQLRDRSWWTGPEMYVVVDDYDLVVTPAGNPLAPLLPLLAQGRDVGLHLVVARRVAGAAKMFFEPITSRLREVSPAGLVLSGDREEGPILGSVRASEQPPGRGVLVTRRSAPALVHVAVDEAATLVS